MDSATISTIKQQLLDEKARIEQELSQFAHRNPKVAALEGGPDSAAGDEEGENASEVAQLSDNLSLEDELKKAIRDIDGALKTIDAGTYGICKYCKQPIDERRLAARPTSSSCIQCKKTLTQEV
jgi:RNA polymerase-binding protein DksA